jgi:hypothetical protein
MAFARHVNIVHHTMPQYSLKSGLKKFKEKGEAPVSNDRMQLHTKDTFEPHDSTKLDREQKSNALESLMFLKDKRDDSIRGRVRRWKDTTRGLVEIRRVIITSTISAFEGRDVAIVDVSGAFLTAGMDGESEFSMSNHVIFSVQMIQHL